MDILLINGNREKVPYPVPPIGLSLVASAAEKAGHQVTFLDLTFEHHPLKAIAKSLSKSFGCVGLSMRNLDNCDYARRVSFVSDFKAMVSAIRALTSVPIVLGGSALSVAPQALLQAVGADLAVVGDGEEAFVDLLAVLAQGGDPAAVQGVLVSSSVHQQVQPRFADLTTLPRARIGRWTRLKPYMATEGVYPVQSKRGCALECVYCTYVNHEGKRYRLRNPEEVADEVAEVVADHGVRDFEFVDSTFNLPIRHAVETCRALARRRSGARFVGSSINPTKVTQELADAMVSAGFVSVLCTAESASDRALEGLRKGFTRAEVAETARVLGAAGLRTLWLFLIGGPGETPETVEETLSFIHGSLGKNDVAFIARGIRVYPDTGMEAVALREGLIRSREDLIHPVFYMNPSLNKEWLESRLHEASRRDGRIILSDTTQSPLLPLGMRILRLAGAKKPLWRFVPAMNRVLHAL
ncbi:MAG: radical SAM protein [Planctomycetota bacterium]